MAAAGGHFITHDGKKVFIPDAHSATSVGSSGGLFSGGPVKHESQVHEAKASAHAPATARHADTASWVASQTPNEEAAFVAWSAADDECDAIREYQRTGKSSSPSARTFANTIEASIARGPIHQGVIYRGLSDLSEADVAKFSEGAEISHGALTSFTKSRQIAENFAKGGKDGTVSIVCQVMSNKTAVDMTRLSDIPGEQEVLSPSRAKYRVQKISPSGIPGFEGKVYRVQLKEVTEDAATQPTASTKHQFSRGFGEAGSPGTLRGSWSRRHQDRAAKVQPHQVAMSAEGGHFITKDGRKVFIRTSVLERPNPGGKKVVGHVYNNRGNLSFQTHQADLASPGAGEHALPIFEGEENHAFAVYRQHVAASGIKAKDNQAAKFPVAVRAMQEKAAAAGVIDKAALPTKAFGGDGKWVTLGDGRKLFLKAGQEPPKGLAGQTKPPPPAYRNPQQDVEGARPEPGTNPLPKLSPSVANPLMDRPGTRAEPAVATVRPAQQVASTAKGDVSTMSTSDIEGEIARIKAQPKAKVGDSKRGAVLRAELDKRQLANPAKFQTKQAVPRKQSRLEARLAASVKKPPSMPVPRSSPDISGQLAKSIELEKSLAGKSLSEKVAARKAARGMQGVSAKATAKAASSKPATPEQHFSVIQGLLRSGEKFTDARGNAVSDVGQVPLSEIRKAVEADHGPVTDAHFQESMKELQRQHKIALVRASTPGDYTPEQQKQIFGASYAGSSGGFVSARILSPDEQQSAKSSEESSRKYLEQQDILARAARVAKGAASSAKGNRSKGFYGSEGTGWAFSRGQWSRPHLVST